MKKELQITDCKEGVASNGNKYTAFKTNAGITCIYDQKLAEQLKQVQHDEIAVCEVEENQKGDKIFFNIIKLIELKRNDNLVVSKENIFPKPATTPNATQFKPGSRNGTDKNCELMTAKDIFCNLMQEHNMDKSKEVMTLAIELVKQAREGLE